MASKIIRAHEPVQFTTLEWQHVGEIAEEVVIPMPAEPVAAEVVAEPPPVLARQLELEFEAKLHEQCELARRQGEAAGRQKVQQELQQKFQELARAIESAASHKSRLRQQAERDVVELALAIARRILHRQIQIDPESIAGLVKAAFESANAKEVYQVRIHPEYAQLVQAQLTALGAPVAIQTVPDASLARGSVVLETSRGRLDASVETQLDEISRGFADALAWPGRCA